MERQLFGGAIIVSLPASMMDASDVRPVPDNQEMWFCSKGQSVVVEVVERVPNLEDATSAAFFFTDLAEQNASSMRETNDARAIDASVLRDTRLVGSVCSGVQRIHMSGRDVPVRVHVACLRIASEDTDLLLSVTTPIPEPGERADTQHDASTPLCAPGDEVIDTMIRTLRIVDYGLFRG